MAHVAKVAASSAPTSLAASYIESDAIQFQDSNSSPVLPDGH
jgi:hypothetical protein